MWSECPAFALDIASQQCAWRAEAKALRAAVGMPWRNVFGGCSGTDRRHVTRVASALRGPVDLPRGMVR